MGAKGKIQFAAGKVPLKRLEAVQALIVRCWAHNRIENALAAEWGVDPRTIRSYIKRVYDAMRVDDEQYKQTRRDRMRGALEDLYDRAVKAGNHTAAATALDRLAKVDGCYVERVEVSGPNGGPLEISVDAAVEELAKHVAQAVKK